MNYHKICVVFILLVSLSCQKKINEIETCIPKEDEITEAIEKEPISKHIRRELPLQQGQTECLIHTIDITSTSVGDSIYSEESYNAVYIDQDKKSEVYDELINTDKDQFFTASKTYTKHKIPNSSSLPRKWISLQPYKDKLYIYASLIARPTYIELSDSLLYIYRTGEGDFGLSYSHIKKEGNTYKIEDLNIDDKPFYIKNIKITILNKDKGIALFEYTDGEDDIREELYVGVNKMRNYALIIQHSSTSGLVNKPDYYPIEPQNLDSIVKALRK